MSDDKYAQSDSITVSSDSNTLPSTDTYTIDPKYWEYTQPNYVREETSDIKDVYYDPLNPNNMKLTIMKGGDEDMRYLYEVILVNPKNDAFMVDYNIAKTETSALMTVYNNSDFKDIVKFDDLKTSCRVLMEYKEEKSLKKAIETIKKAVE